MCGVAAPNQRKLAERPLHALIRAQMTSHTPNLAFGLLKVTLNACM